MTLVFFRIKRQVAGMVGRRIMAFIRGWKMCLSSHRFCGSRRHLFTFRTYLPLTGILLVRGIYSQLILNVAVEFNLNFVFTFGVLYITILHDTVFCCTSYSEEWLSDRDEN